jgi:stringent starvation protein B
VVPVDHVVAIYARENGQGMAFPVPTEGGARASDAVVGDGSKTPTPLRGLRLASSEPVAEQQSAADHADAATPAAPAAAPGDDEPPDPVAPGPRPTLKRVK